MEGWTDFNGQSRKFHYIPADTNEALCGKWSLSPFVANARQHANLQADKGVRGFKVYPATSEWREIVVCSNSSACRKRWPNVWWDDE